MKKFIVALVFLVIFSSFVVERKAIEFSFPAIVQLRILETTDLHAQLMDYSYSKMEPTIEYGLVRTATLIKQARREVHNSMLFDVGDLLKGNELADYVATVKKLKQGEIHPVFQAMNLLNYDAATVGNHEFNFGLDFLTNALKGANFPYVNANVYIDDHNQSDFDDLNYFTPYQILNKTVVDMNGRKHHLKVGVIGLVTPLIMHWDKSRLLGKVKVKGIAETAEMYIPIMKQKGADLVIVLAHSGLDVTRSANNKIENTIYPLSKVKGIDAILFGHAHQVFPEEFPSFVLDGVDVKKGTINGVPAVQADYWGNALGVVDLQLEKINGNWKVVTSNSSTRFIYKTIDGEKHPLVNPNFEIVEAVKQIHAELIKYLQQKKGNLKK